MLRRWAQRCGLVLDAKVLPVVAAVLTWCSTRCYGHNLPARPAGLAGSWASPCWSLSLPLRWGSRLAPSPQQVSFMHSGLQTHELHPCGNEQSQAASGHGHLSAITRLNMLAS